MPDALKSPETTGKWERALGRIAKGAMPPDRFMGSITRYVEYIVREAAAHKSNVVFPQEPYRGKKKSSSKGSSASSASRSARYGKKTGN